MGVIECALVIAPNGGYWFEPDLFVPVMLDGTPPTRRVVRIEDGSGRTPPGTFWVMPDLPPNAR